MTESDLYAMAMESDTAYRHMAELCAALGMPFPPEKRETDTAKRDALPDPFLETTESAA